MAAQTCAMHCRAIVADQQHPTLELGSHCSLLVNMQPGSAKTQTVTPSSFISSGSGKRRLLRTFTPSWGPC
jgi:hypothetical protein